MDQERKKQWIKALRSGEYEQGRGYLRQDASFCCLGVLCDIYAKDTGKGQWELDYYPLGQAAFRYSSALVPAGSFPPVPVKEWSGISDAFLASSLCWLIPGLEMRDERAASLNGLNDSGMTFDQIADVIEYFF